MDHKRTLRAVYNGVILLLLIGGAYLVIDRFLHFGNVEFTDNATVRQYITPVDTRVQGFIREIRFEEYQPVHKGDTLVIIEDADFACGWHRQRPIWPLHGREAMPRHRAWPPRRATWTSAMPA